MLMAINWIKPDESQVATSPKTPKEVVAQVRAKLEKFTSHYYGSPEDLTKEKSKPQNLLVDREFKEGDRKGQRFKALKISVGSEPVSTPEITSLGKQGQLKEIQTIIDELEDIEEPIFKAWQKVQARMQMLGQKRRGKNVH